jgi:uncharacterized protein (DUF305 family)
MPRLLMLVSSLAVLALAGCGGDSGGSESGLRGNGVDRAFAAEMVPHHQAAIAMAELAERRARTKPVRQIAGAIAHLQEEEIFVLRREDRALAAEGVERGELGVPAHMTGMDDDAGTLRRVSGQAFDRAFLEAMIPHHEGAIAMARAELERGGDPELRDLAQRIVTSQTREIRFMRRALAGDGSGGEGGAAVPDGGQATGHDG